MTDFTFQALSTILDEVEDKQRMGLSYIRITFPRVLNENECDLLKSYLQRLHFTILKMAPIAMEIYK